jgi:HPt (histidine-containing phosphotransfer) domain-containing protein
VRAVLAKVPAEAGRCVADIDRAVHAGDMGAARRAAHRLKGMAGNLGAVRLAQLSRSIELGSGDVASLLQRMPELQSTLSATLEAMDAAG